MIKSFHNIKHIFDLEYMTQTSTSFLKYVVLALLSNFMVNTLVFAGSFDININELEAEMKYNFSQNYEQQNEYGLQMFTDDKKNSVISAFFGTSPIGTGESSIARAGIKVSLASLSEIDESGNFASLYGGVGFSMATNIPSIILINFTYSPSVLSFSGFKNYYDYSVSYELLLTPLFIVYTGHRNYVYIFSDKVEHENFTGNNFHLSQTVYFGIRFKF